MYRNTSKVTLKEIRHFVRYFRVIHLVRKLHKQKKDYSTTSRVFTLEHTCSSVIFFSPDTVDCLWCLSSVSRQSARVCFALCLWISFRLGMLSEKSSADISEAFNRPNYPMLNSVQSSPKTSNHECNSLMESGSHFSAALFTRVSLWSCQVHCCSVISLSLHNLL